ncbi:MAG: dienelactone hydrolase family protein [Dehalococcoidia bacterium]
MLDVRTPLSRETRELFFRYDKDLELNTVERPLEAPEGIGRTHFTISSTHDQRVPGILHTPDGPGPFPLVVMQHGAGSEKSAEYITRPAEYWALNEGWALLAIDAPRRGERASEAFDRTRLWGMPYLWRDHAIQTAQDLMRALDYAETRAELDLGRVGYIGVSMGTILGVAFVALDQRVRTGVFTIGGSVTAARIAENAGGRAADLEIVSDLIDCASYAPMVSPRPVLMINGLQDEVVPPAAGERLYAAFQEPKRIKWYTGGHFGMTGKEFKLIREFLRETL